MFRQRILVVLILTPLWIFVIFKGGMVFASVMAVALSIAAWEYRNMFTIGGYQPAAFALISGAVSFPLAHALVGLDWDMAVLALLVLASMAVHILAF